MKKREWRIESGQFGWDYLLTNNKTGEEWYIQTDWDYIPAAEALGWEQPKSFENNPSKLIASAQKYLDRLC